MTDLNVVNFPRAARDGTTLETLQEAQAENLQGVAILGIKDDDTDWYAVSGLTIGQCVILLERLKLRMIE